MRIVKAKLVTIVFPFGTGARLTKDPKQLGASGYTTMRVDGFGNRGARKYGLTDGANVRLEAIVTPEVCDRILKHLGSHYADIAFVAHAHDVEAIPAEHFEPSE